MTNKILYGFAVLAIAALAVLNINLSANRGNVRSISLVNVEMLAYGEDNPSDGTGTNGTGTNGTGTNGTGTTGGTIGAGATTDGVYATATYSWVVNSYGMRVQVQTGCKVSYSGQCTWSVGLTVTF